MKWQTIETAPKNGERILLYRYDWAENVCVGYWDITWEDWYVVGGGTPWIGATHWTAIPPLPKISTTKLYSTRRSKGFRRSIN